MVVMRLKPRLESTDDGAHMDEIIAVLEKSLEEAKEGQVAALALVKVRPDGRVRTALRGAPRFSHDLVAGTSSLQLDLVEDVERDDV